MDSLGAGLALGLAVLGAGYAIGKLAAAALEGAARQPEIQGKLQVMMILAIAFIEALALIALLFAAFLI
jgi:F-type H+-transporting ATPase subunit c